MYQSILKCTLLAFSLSGVAFAQDSASMPGVDSSALRPAQGYLGDNRPDPGLFLPAPPAADSTLGKAELQIFRDTRALKDNARWEMAARDAAGDHVSMFKAFSCAVGADITPTNAPATEFLLRRVLADVSPIIGKQKNLYARPRPFTVAEGETCVDAGNLRNSGSYPSGHSVLGWSWALVLAELVPEHADQIMARGRAFAESRIVCGVHYPSDIAGGQLTATTVMMALQTNAEFTADRDKARTELNALLSVAVKPDSAQCALEAEMSDRTPW